MTGRRRAGGLLGVVLVLGLAGCGAPVPAAPAAPAPVAPGSRLPARPAELRMDAVDPCALLTPAQERQLGVEPGRAFSEGDEFHSPVCLWGNLGGPPDNRWLARLVTQRGADYALGNTQPTQVVQVDGFAAVQTASDSHPELHCLVLVDVAQGQTLWAQYDDIAGNYPNINHEVACKLTRDFAQMAVANLRALAK